jgi:ABC-type lipoprotein export system ATPase subunit
MNIIDVLKPVEFTYPKDDKYIYCIPEGINISANKMYSIQGISGSGKSTILTLLAALRQFRQGIIEYTFMAKNVIKVPPTTWQKWLGLSFGAILVSHFRNPNSFGPSP